MTHDDVDAKIIFILIVRDSGMNKMFKIEPKIKYHAWSKMA